MPLEFEEDADVVELDRSDVPQQYQSSSSADWAASLSYSITSRFDISQDGTGDFLDAAARAGWTEGEMGEAVKRLADFDADEYQKYSRAKFSQAETLPAVVLINNGRFDDLGLSDVQALFAALDEDGSGHLDFDEISAFFMEVLKPPCTEEQVKIIFKLTDQRADGKVSPEELYRALTQGHVKQHLVEMQQEEHALKAIKDLQWFTGYAGTIDGDFFLERLRWAVERDDSFTGLPFSLVFITIFVCLVIMHLVIFERQRIETGLSGWMAGFSGGPTGPYFHSIADIDGMWYWLSETGLAAVFGNCDANFIVGHNSSCLVGSSAVLVGDARLYLNLHDGSELSVRLLSTEAARAVLESRPASFLDAAQATIRDLRSRSWAVVDDTIDFNFAFNTFSLDSQMFAATTMQVHMDDFGYVAPIIGVSAVMVEPYPFDIGQQIVYYAIDCLFILLLLIPLKSELKDLMFSIRVKGCVAACTSYWGLWNLVDWASISVGFTGIWIWIISCLAMGDDSIHRLLQRNDDGELTLAAGVMNLNEKDLAELDDALGQIISLFFVLRVVMALNSIIIVFKFFKGTQANPRLKIVTETLTKASADIFHWTVIFLAVFIGFSVTGHILFGLDFLQFRAITVSIDSCFRTLMGEFDWYSDVAALLESLPSGMPMFLVPTWYYIFMVFVLLILVNMLLAIVLEHYGVLQTKVSTDTDAFPLWEQAYGFIRERRQHKGFIPRGQLLQMLDSEESEAHIIHSCMADSSEITEKTLMKMFPKMKEAQAGSLMNWLEHQAIRKGKEHINEMEARLRKLEGLTETIEGHLNTLKLNVALCTSKVYRNQKAKNGGSKTLPRKQSHGESGRDFESLYGLSHLDMGRASRASRGSRRSQSPHQRPSNEPPSPLAREDTDTTVNRDSLSPHQRPSSPLSPHQRHSSRMNTNKSVTSRVSTMTVIDQYGRRLTNGFGGELEPQTPKQSIIDPVMEPVPKTAPMAIREQMDYTTHKLGSAVQDLQWQLGGAVERLEYQVKKFMSLSQDRVDRPPKLEGMLSVRTASIASPCSGLRSEGAQWESAPIAKEIPPCWSFREPISSVR